MEDLQTNYENLANAIIIRSVLDYQYAKKTIPKMEDKCQTASDEDKKKLHNKILELKSEIERIEKFLTGKWFKVLTSIDGIYILNSIRNN